MVRSWRRVLQGSLLVVLLSFVGKLQAQQFNISSNPSIETCTGALEDSGGPSGEYGNNENFTTVICPSNPGDVITLQFVVANLDMSGAQNTWDRIRVWNGNNTTEPFMGEYTGADGLAGFTFAASQLLNTTGCLTVQFISNGTGTGNFAAIITCETPCDRPTAVATMSEANIPAMICQGEVVNFDGSGSTAAGNFELVSHTWNFADGTTAQGQTASHSWDVPGEYMVQLNVVDDNGCINTNTVDLQVFVSTTPDFTATGIVDMVACVGAEVELSAEGIEAVTWTGVPDGTSTDDIFIEDLIGVPFTSTITFSSFLPGQTLTDCADIQSVCVDMEHSFMGDIVISLSCPNGSTQIFHQQNGGGTNLGTPGTGNAMGETEWYCWSPTATNGTWVDNSGGTMLPPGTYEPLNPCTPLVGCPLNGTWTLTFLDLWGADDGWLNGWQININPALVPDVTEFTPVLGVTSSDSAGWSGLGITVDPNNPLLATAAMNTVGEHPFTFSVTDNFGCAYDTTITISVPPPIELDAGEPIVLCSDPLPMAGAIVANGPPPNCVWEIFMQDSWGDGWNGASLSVTVNGTTTNHTMSTGTQLTVPIAVTTGQTIQISFNGGSFDYEITYTLLDDSGNVLYTANDPDVGIAYNETVVCGGGSSAFTYEWTPTTGLDNPSSPTTNVLVSEPTWFYLASYPVGYPECAVTDSVLVSPDPSIDAGVSNTITLCESDPIIQLTDSLDGTPDAGGVWTNSGGVAVSNTFSPANDPADTYTYTIISGAGCVASSTLAITVIPAEDPLCCGVVDAGLDAFTCGLTIELTATRGNTGVGNWQGPTGAVFADPNAETTAVTMPAGSGGTYTFYWVENDGAFCNLIDSVQKTFTDAYAFTATVTDALCFGYCDGEVSMLVTGGNAVDGLNFAWSNGFGGVNDSVAYNLCAGSYTLTVTDDNGCQGSTEVVVGEPILLEVDSLVTLPVTCSGDCDGSVLVFDAEAVEYSYDDGLTYTTEPIQVDACEGLWKVRIKDAIGCIGSARIEVTGPPPVVAAFEWGPQPANVDAPTITFANTSTGSDHYYWNIMDLFSTTDVNTIYTFNNKEPGIYEVCLTAYNYNECADTVCQLVVIDDVLFTYIPNAFTPDGDDVNDVWWPTANIPVRSNYELLVFDRWGEVVFSTTDPYMPWRGSYQNGGEALKSDVYLYRLMFGIGETEARREITGHVTLLK